MKKRRLNYRLISAPRGDLALCSVLAFTQKHLDASCKSQITEPPDRTAEGRDGGWWGRQTVFKTPTSSTILSGSSCPEFADVLPRTTETQSWRPRSQREAYPEVGAKWRRRRRRSRRRKQRTTLKRWQMWGVSSGLLQMRGKAPFNSQSFQLSLTCHLCSAFS